MTPAPFGILGGTFDPVHDGHLAVAAAARTALGLATVQLAPARYRRTGPGRSSRSIIGLRWWRSRHKPMRRSSRATSAST